MLSRTVGHPDGGPATGDRRRAPGTYYNYIGDIWLGHERLPKTATCQMNEKMWEQLVAVVCDRLQFWVEAGNKAADEALRLMIRDGMSRDISQETVTPAAGQGGNETTSSDGEKEATPEWNSECLTLTVRRIPVPFRRRSRGTKVIDAFFKAGWKRRIKMPVSDFGEDGPKQLREVIRLLNIKTRGLIRFRVEECVHVVWADDNRDE